MSFFYTETDNVNLDLKDGSSQSGRLLDALLPSHVQIMEKSISDHLIFAKQLAQHFNYYNALNEPDGDWVAFFEKDESVILSIISHTDLDQINKEYDGIMHQLNSALSLNARLRSFKALFELIGKQIRLVDDWYRIFRRYSYLSDFNTEIKNAMSHLTVQLSALEQYAEGSAKTENLKFDVELNLQGLSDEWYDTQVTIADIYVGRTVVQKLEHAVSYVDEVFNTFFKSITFLVQYAEIVFKDTLEKRQDHLPHIGLYLTFLQLLKYTDAHINGITKRHLDHYYYNILQQKRRKATPDHIHVLLKTPSGKTVVSSETKFLAGLDKNGAQIVFTSNNDLQVSAARISELKTTYVNSYPMVYNEDEDVTITGNSLYAAPVANSRDGFGTALDEANMDWPLIGEDQFELSYEERTMADAILGIILACPILELPEGDRCISIRLEVEPASYKELDDYVSEYAYLNEITWKNSFHRLMHDSLECHYTSAEGWLEYDKPLISSFADEANNDYGLLIELHYRTDDPVVAVYNDELYTEGYGLEWPAIKLLLNNYATFSGYAAMKPLVLRQVTIDTEVKDYQNMSVITNAGPVNTDNPFLAFGPAPMIGAYFAIGDPRIVNRYLQNLNLKIDWLDLPSGPTGFKGFYKSYNIDIDNDSFEIDVSVVAGNQYQPEPKKRQLFKLFQSMYKEPNAQPLSEYTKINDIDFTKLPIKSNHKQPGEDFATSLQDGYLRFALVQPYTCFGHNMFPKVFSRVAMHNAVNKKKTQELPDIPYTPNIKSIEVNYTARVSEDMRSGANREAAEQGLKIIHLHPFGTNLIYPGQKQYGKHILPQMEVGGTLYLGFEELDTPEIISILFQMRDVIYTELTTPRDVQWSYLADNVWRSIEPRRVLSDTTGNLVNTGIVTLSIPNDINDNNSLMPDGKFWIAAYVPGNANILRRVLEIRPHAVSATRVLSEKNEQYELPILPANSVTNGVLGTSRITSVSQPFTSFEGRRGETEEEFYARVSENLNHKLRAVNIYDYEKLILEKFPELFITKCIGKINQDQELLPGNNIQVIVIPRALSKAVVEVDIPKISYTRLTEIKQFIEEHSSNFVNAEVSNPIYERVKVKCSVKFGKSENIGHLVQKLNEELRHFLSPWMFDSEAELRLGGFINRSEILTFIENRPYVRYVTRFSVIQIYRSYETSADEYRYHLVDTADESQNIELLVASSPYAVLIAATQHEIEVIDAEEYMKPGLTSLGFMKVKDDLIMGEVKPVALRTNDDETDDKSAETEEGAQFVNFIISHDID